MPERSTIFQTAQIGLESTPGTNVPANKKLLATSIEPAVPMDVKTFRAMGTKFPALAAQGKEWVEARVAGQGAYNDISYLLASLMQTPTFTQQGVTIAYKSTHTIANAAADTISTFSVEHGSAVRAHEFSYGIMRELALEFSRNGVNLTGVMLGNGYVDGAAMTGSPTEIALQPILPTEVTVSFASTAAGLPGTILTRVLRANINIANRFAPLWVLNAATPNWVAHVETEPNVRLGLFLEADSAGMGFLTAARDGSSRFFRIKCEGPIIASTYKWTLQWDVCTKVVALTEFRDDGGVYAVDWGLVAAYDPTWQKAVYAEVINTLTAL
jgi:hypothetical protein